jgi:two-component system CheB/CheR fusion protein
MTVSKKRGVAKKKSARAARPAKLKTKVDRPDFPVAAIGASAGGIEAISTLLQHLPADLGIAYIVIQHISPNYESILPEILEKKTVMKVHQVADKMSIAPDNIYVIPPNHDMSIIDGKLMLSPPQKTKGAIRSVDFFLTALAKVYQHNAIAIILSGTAYDGSEGVEAIKAEGGITFAQDESARFQGMPVHASETGYVDFVMSPEKIAQELTEMVRRPYGVALQNDLMASGEDTLKKIYLLLHNKKDVDFSYYKKTTINRRILRRMNLHRLKNLDNYIQMLRDNPDEINLLYKDLLINVTSFFRDPTVFHALSRTIFPSILKNRKSTDTIRIWAPACATGEEAYSIAICLFEFLKDKAINTPVQIFATDLNESAIEKARQGIYHASLLSNLSKQRLNRFFIKIDGKYQVIKPIRDVCIFAPHNLLSDPPFSHIDVISCQNVMIYLEANPQKKILQAFHYALKSSGFLLLGKSESIGSSVDLFEQADKELKIYTKKAAPVNFPLFDFTMRRSRARFSNSIPGDLTHSNELNETDIEKEADKLLLSRYVPASVVVNKDLNIVRFNGKTADYLEPASGKATLHLLKMIREELLFELRALIIRAKNELKSVKKEKIPFSDKEVTIEVAPLKSADKNPYYLILFKETPAPAGEKQQAVLKGGQKNDPKLQRIKTLEQEISDSRHQVKAISEEFEATREELQTANEEVLSSNEELQSINEELETSKEELQSANEELTTINEELRLRNNELKETRDYALAIVETIHEPLVVMNPDFTVRTANKAFYTLFRTSADVTEGLYFFGLQKEAWNIDELKTNLHELVWKNKVYEAFEISHNFPVIGQKVFCFHVIRMDQPDNNKGRILMAIEDITRRKASEMQLKKSEENFRLLVQNSADIITVFSPDGTILYQSESVKKVLGYSPEETIGKNIFRDSFVHPDDRPAKEAMFIKAQATSQESILAEFRLRHKKGFYKVMEAACINQLNDPRIGGIVANYRDVTEKKKLEKQKEEFISVASHELKTPVTSIKAYAQLLTEKFVESKDMVATGWAKKMENQVERLSQLISELLDTTRISEGQLKLDERSFDLVELIKEKVEEMQMTAPRHKIKTKLKKLPMAWGDRERTGQVIVNYISNAIKYSPGASEVVISCSGTKDNITVSVQDFGIGIAPALKSKIFSRFFRAENDNFRTFPGLGLGLYIASEIITRQKGKVWLESKKNKGSTFFFSLPVIKG